VIEHGVAEFARGSNGGLIVTVGPFGANHPDFIVALAARYGAAACPLAGRAFATFQP